MLGKVIALLFFSIPSFGQSAYFGGGGPAASAGPWTTSGTTVQLSTPTNGVSLSPPTPVLAGSVSNSGMLGAGWSWVDGGRYAYVTAMNTSTFTIVDVTYATSPVIVSQLYDPSKLNGNEGVQCAGNYCYVGNFSGNGFTVIDKSNPASPKVAASIIDATNLVDAEAIYLYGTTALVLGISHITSIDISSPTVPRILSSITNLNFSSVTAGCSNGGKYFYAASELGGGISTIDISNPAALSFVGFKSVGVEPASIVCTDRYLYVSDFAAGHFYVMDIINPASPVLVNSVNVGGLNPIVFAPGPGKNLYAADYAGGYIETFSLANPAYPTIISKTLVGTPNGPNDIKVQGRYAYIASLVAPEFLIVDLIGIQVPSLQADNINSGQISASELMQAASLNVKQGIEVGPSGISDQGPIAASQGIINNSLAVGTTILPSGTVFISSGNVQIISTSTVGTDLIFNVENNSKQSLLTVQQNGDVSISPFFGSIVLHGSNGNINMAGQLTAQSLNTDGGGVNTNGSGQLTTGTLIINNSFQSDTNVISSDGSGNLSANTYTANGGAANTMFECHGGANNGLMMWQNVCAGGTVTATGYGVP